MIAPSLVPVGKLAYLERDYQMVTKESHFEVPQFYTAQEVIRDSISRPYL